MVVRPDARPTLEAVAAHAGVSRATVSRVINDSPKVSPEAKAAVLSAIEKLGYVPNPAARTLVTRRTDAIALVVSESEERVFAEPFFADIVRGISTALADTELQLLLIMAQSPTQRRRLQHYLSGQRVDGVLLLSLHGNDPLPRMLEQMGVPSVLGGTPTGVEPASYVEVDNLRGAQQAVEYLLGLGRRRIATIAGPQDMNAGVRRLLGYRQAISTGGLRVDENLIAQGDFSEESGARAMRKLLARSPDLDAVFAASDPMAIGAMRVLKEHGRAIPGDVALIGFDDSPSARHTDPPLTTVHQPVEAMGREMARLLLARIRGDERAEPVVILDAHLVRRASA